MSCWNRVECPESLQLVQFPLEEIAFYVSIKLTFVICMIYFALLTDPQMKWLKKKKKLLINKAIEQICFPKCYQFNLKTVLRLKIPAEIPSSHSAFWHKLSLKLFSEFLKVTGFGILKLWNFFHGILNSRTGTSKLTMF